MSHWMEDLSHWMQNQEAVHSPLNDLSEEIYQTALDTDSLLESCAQLEPALATLVEKIDHGSARKS